MKEVRWKTKNPIEVFEYPEGSGKVDFDFEDFINSLSKEQIEELQTFENGDQIEVEMIFRKVEKSEE